MKIQVFRFVGLFLIFSLMLTACDSVLAGLTGKKVEIQIIYGSEKQEWLDPLIISFNDSRQKTADGSVITVTGTAMGSIESIDGIMKGTLKPTVWSPASSLYLPVANVEWKKDHSGELYTESPKDLVLSPVVIAMWKPMAEALGWPEKSLGWVDIANLAVSEKGWDGLGYPEWGGFKFGHTHPEFSNSGLVSVIAQAYAGSSKQKDLTLADLKSPVLSDFIAKVQSSIIHYGTSTGFFATRMFEGGPSYLSASVLYENLVVAQEIKRLSGQSNQLPVVAIYPKEGTFWANHPYVILDAEWVAEPQKEAATIFRDYLLAKPQQQKAIEIGFRPADPSIPLTSPLDVDHGMDVQQPKTVLEVPTAEVIEVVIGLWKQVKKPVDLVLAIDTSGSMAGEKIAAARSSLIEFIKILDDRDRLQILTFNTGVHVLTPMSEIGQKRADLIRRIGGIIEGGDTTLYDAAIESVSQLEKDGDIKHIRAVVLLTDGQDTASRSSFDSMLQKIGPQGKEGGNSIKLFTIGFGNDSDKETLKKMAEITGGKNYSSDPQTIQKVYSDIATFF
jgi:Ca-activated chloride channel family protein